MSAFWSEKKVFITGITGFVGYWLAERLLEQGACVVGLVRDCVPESNFSRFRLADRIVTVSGALEDYGLLERTINEYDIDTVFHLGAQTQVGVGNRSPLATFETNIRGTWNLLEACRVHASMIRRVVVASSDKAYGDQKILPYTEDAPLQGSHPYDVSKSCTDLLASTYFNTYGLPVCITRCGNIYGPGDTNLARLIPGIITWVLKGEPIVIRSDGMLVRDYFYVRDAVSAYMLLAETMEARSVVGEAFNFSSGLRISVLDMTKKILAVMHKTSHPVQVLNEARGEIRDQYLSSDKAARLIGWQPDYGLDEALAETVDYYARLLQER
ncbi:MAG: NAD-dependent epimerase/dehydratase family protein [Deltaproteobacteria bacterium]|nr:NAD-dependent epimerase/dehydratase family protein [Deltaproteobacteria bacterium]